MVLAGTDVTRSHTFRVANTSGRPVKILGVANRKPCCGEVEPIPATTLGPGQAVEVAVTLHIGLAAGRVIHLAEIQTEGDGGKILATELRTMGTGLARATVEVVGSAPSSLDPGELAKVELIARSFGNRERPPFPLDDRAIRCDVPFDWKGIAEDRLDPGSGLDELHRPLVVTLDASGEPGRRWTTLELLDGGSAVARKTIAWEVAPAIKATPPGLVLSADSSGPWKIMLRGRDDRPFRVVSASSKIEGLMLTPVGGEARTTHTLTFRLVGPPWPETRTGEIVVETDNPRQPLVKVSIHIPGQGHAEAKSDLQGNPSR